jgi:integrase
MAVDGALRQLVEGELQSPPERVAACKRGYVVRSTALVVVDAGQRLTVGPLRSRFDDARERAGEARALFQFRDLRGKAGTDKTDLAGDIRQAQKQLGHASVTMTEHYVRARRGDVVKPASRVLAD